MMSREGSGFTRWGVIASGEGGNRVAAELLSRSENPGIGERVALLNTNRSDIQNTVDQSDIDGNLQEHVEVFGDKRGVGNDFLEGERQTERQIDKITGTIHDNVQSSDALFYLSTVGGGTGNGSVPYLIREYDDGTDVDRREYGPWMDAVKIALAIWPYYDEPAQRHFNAMCGLSRLLRTRDRDQNAGMVLLASNSHLDDSESRRGSYDKVNRQIVEAIDLMIGAGREAKSVIDAEDYIANPSAIGAYHFTPAVATGLNGKMLEFELMFDRAAQNTFVPMDISTTRAAFAVVRAPERMIERGEVTETQVQQAFEDWKQENDLGPGTVGMSTLIPSDERGSEVDVLLLLGGFDLNDLLDHARESYEGHKRNLESARQMGTSEDAISGAHLDDLERNLEEYVDANSR